MPKIINLLLAGVAIVAGTAAGAQAAD